MSKSATTSLPDVSILADQLTKTSLDPVKPHNLIISEILHSAENLSKKIPHARLTRARPLSTAEQFKISEEFTKASEEGVEAINDGGDIHCDDHDVSSDVYGS